MEELFEKLMGDVQPIEKKERVTPSPTRTPIAPKEIKAPVVTHAHAQQRERKQQSGPWTLKESGVSNEQIRRLRTGKMAIDVEIDLHGMRRDEATSALRNFVEMASASGARVLSIVHGRGLHSKDGQPVLKDEVYRWLQDGPYTKSVLAVVPKLGSGGGACLLLLRRIRGGG